MNKILSLLCVSFLAVLLVSMPIAFAEEQEIEVPIEELPTVGEPELEKEITANVKLPLVKVASVFHGFVVDEENTEAEHLRIVLTKSRYSKLLSVMNQGTVEEIKTIKETETVEQAREKIKTMLQERVQAVESENGMVGGLMIIGKGKFHETYRLVANEITDETATFDVYKLGALKISTRTKQGFLLGVRKAFGLATTEETTEVVEEVDTTQIEPIGTLTVDRTKYEHMEIDYGTLILETSQYEGSWEVTAFSAYKLPLYKKAMVQAGEGEAEGEGEPQNQQQQQKGQSE